MTLTHTHTRGILSFPPQRLPAPLRATIRSDVKKKEKSIVWRIYSICIHNCSQFTKSLFYNLVHLTAAGGQKMVGLQGPQMGPPNMMQSTKIMTFICPTLRTPAEGKRENSSFKQCKQFYRDICTFSTQPLSISIISISNLSIQLFALWLLFTPEAPRYLPSAAVKCTRL